MLKRERGMRVHGMQTDISKKTDVGKINTENGEAGEREQNRCSRIAYSYSMGLKPLWVRSIREEVLLHKKKLAALRLSHHLERTNNNKRPATAQKKRVSPPTFFFLFYR